MFCKTLPYLINIIFLFIQFNIKVRLLFTKNYFGLLLYFVRLIFSLQGALNISSGGGRNPKEENSYKIPFSWQYFLATPQVSLNEHQLSSP